jgi:hypothetical protein
VEYGTGGGGEEMANDVVVGDNIAILCQSSTYKNFWIMLIDIPIHMVKYHFIDAWEQCFEGDYVVQGIWYERSSLSIRSYYQLEDSPLAFVYFHLIVSSKFFIPPTTHSIRGSLSTYELSIEVFDIIHERVACQ